MAQKRLEDKQVRDKDNLGLAMAMESKDQAAEAQRKKPRVENTPCR